MVQFFRGSADPRDAAVGALAKALGGGIGEGVVSYMANNALEKVMARKDLENATPAERMSAIEQAMRPYGQKGLQYMQNRIAIEQQREQEVQQKKMNKKAPILAKRLKGEALTEEEQKIEFTPEEEMAIAKHIQAGQIATAKAANKNPLGGLSGQPMDPKHVEAMNRVIQENPDSSDTELKMKMLEAQIPVTYVDRYIDDRIKERETATKRDIELHNESKKYDEDLTHAYESVQKQDIALNDITNALKSGKVSPWSISNIFKGKGHYADIIADAFKNKDQAAIDASIPYLLEGWKQVFGVRLSDADLKILQEKLPSVSKSVEANEAIVKILRKYADFAKLKFNIGAKIKKANKGLRPVDYAGKVNEEYDRQIAPVKIRKGSQKGKVPFYKLQGALKDEWELDNE